MFEHVSSQKIWNIIDHKCLYYSMLPRLQQTPVHGIVYGIHKFHFLDVPKPLL